MHFHFVKQVIGSVLVEGHVLSRIASNCQLVEFIKQLLKAEIILAIHDLEDFKESFGFVAL